MHPNRSLPFYLFVLFVLLTLACSLPSPTPTALPTQGAAPAFPPVTTVVAIPLPSPTETATQAAEPTVETATATLPAEISPSPEETTSPYLPVGFVADTHDGIGLTLFDLRGQPLTELNTPGQTFEGSPFSVHVAGGMGGGGWPPLIYYTYDNGGWLMLNVDDQVSKLVSAPDLVNLFGAPGQPILAYSTIEYVSNGTRNRLYVGRFDSLANAQPVLDVVDPEAWAVKPLAVVVEEGKPVGVWYTSQAYGIGGDIVFEPRRSLNYLNLVNGDNLTYYGKEISPSALSPDLTWVAYTVGYGQLPLAVDNLYDSLGPVTIALLPDSDRGAGNAVFSPNNEYVAWKEGSGWIMADVPNFHATIRIATTSGAITAEIPDSVLADVLGKKVEWATPVGWLDNETLILEVRLGSWGNVSLLRVRFDGSGMTYLAPGSFVGFLFP